MSMVLEVVVATVYGGSAVIVAGGGLAWKMSRRFRESMVGEHARR